MNLTYCRSCKAPIVYLETEKGKKMPLDHAAVENGNIIILNRLAHFLKAGETPPRRHPAVQEPLRYVSPRQDPPEEEMNEPAWVEADLCSRCALKPVRMSGDTGEQPSPLNARPRAVLA